MWLYLLAGILFILGVGGGLVFGGIFTIILVPIAVIIGVGAYAVAAWGRSSQRSADRPAEPGNSLPRSYRGDSGHVGTSPERLADARRIQQ